MKRSVVLMVFLLSMLPAFSQKPQASELLREVSSLKQSLNHLDTISIDQLWEDTVRDVHGEISQKLVYILSHPLILHYNVDSLLQHEQLEITSSADKKLRLFSWFEKTGGSFHSFLTVIQIVEGKRSRAYFSNYEEENAFPSRGGVISEIHKLPHTSRKLYLCIGGVKGCGSCFAEFAFVVEMKEGALSEYSAFNYPEEAELSTLFLLERQDVEVLKFEYDPKKLNLDFSFSDYETKEETIGQHHWNGTRFVLKTRE